MKVFKHKQRWDGGFALVATLSVMSLLMLLAIGILKLSSITTRNTDSVIHQEIAQGNARMAAIIALGQLQEKLGADQRVSATAAIVSDQVNQYKKNWTTVWDSSNWDPTDPLVTRDDFYLGALVSGDIYSSPATRSVASAELESGVSITDPDWIAIVNEGTVMNSEDYVFVPKVDIKDDANDITGKYAYWVGDEGVKARVDVSEANDAPLNDWAKAGRLASNPGTGIHKIAELANYVDYLPEAGNHDDLKKFLTYQTLNRTNLTTSGPGEANTADVFKANYHNITTSHVGLLTDSRIGGIRKDLSMAFEVEADVFSRIDEFNNSGEVNYTAEYSTFGTPGVTKNPLYYHSSTDPELGYLYEIPVNNSDRFRGPTWDLLRNHYRLYKKERNSLNFRGLPNPSSDALVAHGVVPFSYNGSDELGASLGSVYTGPNYSGEDRVSYQAPFVSPHGKSGGSGLGGETNAKAGNRVQPTVQKITPELLRLVTVYGIARENDKFYFTASPFITFHNPYNYPIEFHSLGLDVRGIGAQLSFDVKYTKPDGTQGSDKIFYQESNYYALKGFLSYRLAPLANGLHRLEPGEIKMMSMQPNLAKATNGLVDIRLTEFGYNEENGALSGHENTLQVKPNTQINLIARGRQTHTTLGGMFARLYHPHRATGGNYVIDDTSNVSANNSRHYNRFNDSEPLSLIKQIKTYPVTKNVERNFAVNQVPNPNDGYLTLIVTDHKMKTFQDDVAVISDFNYRSLGLDPRDYDAADHIGPNWDFDMYAIGSYDDLELTDQLDGGAYWGETHTTIGQSNIVLFDLPRTPSVSLASLQHADTSVLNFHPMRSIANSRPQVGQSDLTKIHNKLRQTRFTTTPKNQLDTSWASNEALWDRYYYSGMNWGTAEGQPYATQTEAIQAIIDGDAHKVFANSRMKLLSPIISNNLSELTADDAYSKIGKYIGITGAFNVNSTSTPAWKAVLAGLSGREISYLSGSSIKEKTLNTSVTPMTRFSTPAGIETDDYMGFRVLNDDELDKLANAIVEQVKLRGPFMGLSDFVNRRLLADDTGKSGAIQAAIDSSAMNDSIPGVRTSDSGLKQSASKSNEGVARHLTQGDILTVLAPVITTRSDTFTIRAYGESLDQNGIVKATAWCEILVQRSTNWVETTTEPSTIPNPDYPAQTPMTHPILKMQIPNPALPNSCNKYGRKFTIQSFRWLSQDEI